MKTESRFTLCTKLYFLYLNLILNFVLEVKVGEIALLFLAYSLQRVQWSKTICSTLSDLWLPSYFYALLVIGNPRISGRTKKVVIFFKINLRFSIKSFFVHIRAPILNFTMVSEINYTHLSKLARPDGHYYSRSIL